MHTGHGEEVVTMVLPVRAEFQVPLRHLSEVKSLQQCTWSIVSVQ